MRSRKADEHRFSVYVIRLDDAVLNERKFAEANPQYEEAQELEVKLAERLRRRGFAVWQN